MADEHPPMSFREKSAWISLLSFLAVYGVYFWNVVRVLTGRPALASPISLFVSLLAILIGAELVLHWLFRRLSPHDARTPKDERELLIELRATRVAFVVLLVGAFASIGTLHVPGASRWTMAQCVMLSIGLAELTNFGTRIALYRRDA
jgi:hypothetical protein